jgi:hypothetical protein
LTRLTCVSGTSNSFESTERQAVFAAPSTGGAVTRTFTVSPLHPTRAFSLERGCTRTTKIAPTSALFVLGILLMATRVQRIRIQFFQLDHFLKTLQHGSKLLQCHHALSLNHQNFPLENAILFLSLF